MNVDEISFRMALIEGLHLAGLVDELALVIAAADEAPDPAIDRLTPAPYPDDPAAAAEFATATRDDLLDRRTADAAVVRRALEMFVDPGEDDEGENEDQPDQIEITIRRAEIDAWLRTLTALRLIIATRLGITTADDDHDPDDARFGVYDWLAYRLDSLIAIADALDEIPDDV
ncbi:DUF2017 family protein [Microbacterium sp.]|uniref:DUF2017 family protein n=1 Tax=Microbacterium sp. TaxID=51671 RepID=UPI002BC57BF9|nr:DUF2017 family protein [Microbacterium sp.]HWK78336.1 DUF2017 family protein [Microbacterium sp.]